ncbi:glucosamine-6-phosphate deaminase [Fibrella forsythiae]|uniref:Glucosamine-6-phosphate deaminase n=1 Tax=Fibrella forsythiae TaxID=2817061 RepID=A0ABS3JLW5_9BACT|nr:glucosamine-6-phosphate deaminase [Fibrella forsythiae]MBO0951006.1 glucosamine-6-phosphate deaminase [Fibrella forsythiae]
MNLRTFPDYATLSAHAAQYIASLIRQKPNAVICIASGSTPEGTFKLLAQQVRTGELDLSQCQFIGLDEWVGFTSEDVGGCAYFLYRDLFTPAHIRPEQITYFDATAANLQAECQRVDEVINRLGGLDLMLVGVGENGHIALNEPGTSWTLRSHVVDLAESTKTVGQKYFTKETPLSQGITLGLHYLTNAREAVLMASGTRKAAIMHTALNRPVTEQCPASIFQTLPDAHVWLDEDATVNL